MKRRRPRSIPRGAVERDGDGCVDYFVGEKLVARVYYHSTGAIDWETHYDAQGRQHGVERQEFPDGRLMYRARYRHGLQIGWQEQWDATGRLVIRKRFVNGTGADLWWGCCNCAGAFALAEERYFVAGQRHGPERWWNPDGTVYSEAWYFKGVEHGIAREWNDAGRMRRGFPRYFVKGERVTLRAYEKARRDDPTLPERTEQDSLPARPLPQLIDELPRER